MNKKYSVIILGFISAFIIITYNLFFINSVLLLLNYGIGFIFGFFISTGTNMLLKKNLIEEQLKLILFSSALFMCYFFLKYFINRIVDNSFFSEIFSVFINTNIFLLYYFNLYKINLSTKRILSGAVLIGFSTFWTELGYDQFLNISIAFWGMALWQIEISIFINKSIISAADTTHTKQNHNKKIPS